jgi:hypothetical protein
MLYVKSDDESAVGHSLEDESSNDESAGPNFGTAPTSLKLKASSFGDRDR